MAKSVTTGVLKFDAADQYEGFANAAEATPPIYAESPIPVQTILIESGATGGAYEVRPSDDSAVTLTGIITLGANSSAEIVIGDYVAGVYIEAFGSDGTITVKTGGIN